MKPLPFIDRLLDGSLFTQGLQKPILDWRRGEQWTMARAMQGTLIVGSTGSGKTSGSGATIARALLRNGFSGLVLTVKTDEPENWQQHCEKEGRLDDLIFFHPGTGYCFNPLEFEPINENRVQLFLKLSELGLGGTTPITDYWIEERKKLLRNLFQLIESAGLTPSVTILAKILSQAPPSLTEVASAAWQRDSACAQAIAEANRRRGIDPDNRAGPRLPSVLPVTSFPLRPRSSHATPCRIGFPTHFALLAPPKAFATLPLAISGSLPEMGPP